MPLQVSLLPLRLQRAVADPEQADAADILALQQVAGNRAVSHLVQRSTASRQGNREEEEGIQTQPAGDMAQQASEQAPLKAVVQRNGGYIDQDFRRRMAARRAAMGYEEEEAGPEPLPGVETQPARPQAYTGRELAEKQEAAASLARVLRPRWQAGAVPGAAPRGQFLGAQPAAPAPGAQWQAGAAPGAAPRGQFLGAHPPAPAAPAPGAQWQAGVAPGAAPRGQFLGAHPAAPAPGRTAAVNAKAHTRLVAGALTGDADQQARQVNRGKWGTLYKQADLIALEEDESAHVKDKDGNVVWYRVKGTVNEYIRAAKVFVGISAAPEEEAGSKKHEALLGAGQVVGMAGEVVNAADERLVEWARDNSRVAELAEAAGTTLSPQQEALHSRVNVAEGVLWAGGGILGMAAGLKFLDSEATAWDWVESAYSMVASGAGIVGGISQIVSERTASEAVSERAGDVASWSLGYQEMFSTVASLVKTAKSGVDMIVMIVERAREGKSRPGREWVQAGAELLTNTLEVLKGAARTARAIYEALGGAVTSVVSQTLSNVAVGLDVVIAAIKSIIQSVYLAVSARQWWLMHKREQELQADLAAKGYTEEETKQARGFYKRREAMVAKLDDLIVRNERTIEAKYDKVAGLSIRGSERQLRNRLATAGKLQDEIAGLRKENEGYKAKKAKLEQEMKEHESTVPATEPGASTEAGATTGPGAGPVPLTRMQLAEVELTAELGSANRKRVIRQGMHLSANLLQIAGGITTLTGVAAPVGISLKAAAAGIDTSMPFFRWVKQKGRDFAAKNVARGETGISNRIFNADKSTAAKLAARKKHAVAILLMVARLNDLVPKAQDPLQRAAEQTALKKQIARVEGYIEATGCPLSKLYAANGKAAEQVKILIEELSKRELGGD